MLAFSYLPNNLQFLAISVFMVQKKDKHKCMAIGNKLECLQHKKQYMKTIAVILALPLIHHRLLWQQKQILQLKGLMDVEKFSGLSSCSTCFCTTAQNRERLYTQYMIIWMLCTNIWCQLYMQHQYCKSFFFNFFLSLPQQYVNLLFFLIK